MVQSLEHEVNDKLASTRSSNNNSGDIIDLPATQLILPFEESERGEQDLAPTQQVRSSNNGYEVDDNLPATQRVDDDLPATQVISCAEMPLEMHQDLGAQNEIEVVDVLQEKIAPTHIAGLNESKDGPLVVQSAGHDDNHCTANRSSGQSLSDAQLWDILENFEEDDARQPDFQQVVEEVLAGPTYKGVYIVLSKQADALSFASWAAECTQAKYDEFGKMMKAATLGGFASYDERIKAVKKVMAELDSSNLDIADSPKVGSMLTVAEEFVGRNGQNSRRFKVGPTKVR